MVDIKRRSFIKKAGIATVGAFVAPYILPTGRLFASTGNRKADHVVFCLYAGGVRINESIQKSEGNLMTNILNGNEAIDPTIAGAMTPLPSSPLSMPLQNYGTLFKNFLYAQGPTGHFNGHTTAMTGVYTTTDLNLKDHPNFPTIFEYYRKHNSPAQSAMNSWWVSNTLGPYPALNYSKYPGYGAQYGANFIAPTFLINPTGNSLLGNMKTFNTNEQAQISKMKTFFDNNFANQLVAGDAGVTNTPADTQTLQNFLTTCFHNSNSGLYNNPWNITGGMSNDMMNIFFAEQIIQQFTPELLVVNMQDVDICHTQYTTYCNNLRKADYAVAHLWNFIQNTPGMANNTIMIVAPEHGRNNVPNSIVDSYGKYALDHTAALDGTGDQVARDIFCLVVGPSSKVVQGQVINANQGESIEIVSSIANILSFDTNIPENILKPFNTCGLQAAFY